MPKVAAVVLNSVTRDARVLKEADSLAAAGHDVTVFGIRDNRDSTPEDTRESGARIVRVDWKAQSYRSIARFLRVVTVIICVPLLLLAFAAGDRLSAVVEWAVTPLTTGALLAGAGLYVARLGLVAAEGFSRSAAIVDASHGHAITTPPRRLSRWHLRRFAAALRRRVRGTRRPLGGIWKRLRVWLARRFGRVALERELVRQLRAHQPDVIHCHDLITVPVGIRAKRATGAKLVYDAHEIYEEVSQLSEWRRRRFRLMQRRVSGHVDAFITVNDHIHDYLRARYPKLPEGAVVCNAVLAPEDPPTDDGRLRIAAGVDAGQRIVLYQGGFARFRGLDILVRSAPLLPDDWTLVMMGWGAYEAELLRIADEVDPHRERVRFIPGAPHAELRSWTAGADLGAIPYENVCLNHWFCSPNKLWEYPSAGFPILASPYPVLSEMVLGNEIGVLLDDPATPIGIAEAVGALTPAALATMRENAIAFVAGDNWSTYEARLISTYEGMREGATPRSRTSAGSP